MSPHPILDTHIHLWPSSACTSKSHSWMKPDHILTRRHGISDYLSAAADVTGFIYVETDRYLPALYPSSTNSASISDEELITWAKEPLSEITFLRRIVEGKGDEDDDGVRKGQEERLKGVVLFAPLHISPASFKRYLALARDAAGSQLWRKVVGFRYLLQGKGDGEVQRLVSSEEWMANLLELSKSEMYGGKKGGWTFDVGADVNRDGVEGLEAIKGMVERVRKREREEDDSKPVRFVISEYLFFIITVLSQVLFFSYRSYFIVPHHI
jgi:L-rhamnono-1,4-lactonase